MKGTRICASVHVNFVREREPCTILSDFVIHLFLIGLLCIVHLYFLGAYKSVT
jgi:hypothetical protein